MWDKVVALLGSGFSRRCQQGGNRHAMAQRGDENGANWRSAAVRGPCIGMAMLIVGEAVERRPGVDDGGQ